MASDGVDVDAKVSVNELCDGRGCWNILPIRHIRLPHAVVSDGVNVDVKVYQLMTYVMVAVAGIFAYPSYSFAPRCGVRRSLRVG